MKHLSIWHFSANSGIGPTIRSRYIAKLLSIATGIAKDKYTFFCSKSHEKYARHYDAYYTVSATLPDRRLFSVNKYNWDITSYARSFIDYRADLISRLKDLRQSGTCDIIISDQIPEVHLLKKHASKLIYIGDWFFEIDSSTKIPPFFPDLQHFDSIICCDSPSLRQTIIDNRFYDTYRSKISIHGPIIDFEKTGRVRHTSHTNIVASHLSQDIVCLINKLYAAGNAITLTKSIEDAGKTLLIPHKISTDEIDMSNVGLLITKGGCISVYESIASRVPVICFPENCDIKELSRVARWREIGIIYDKSDMNRDFFSVSPECSIFANTYLDGTSAQRAITEILC